MINLNQKKIEKAAEIFKGFGNRQSGIYHQYPATGIMLCYDTSRRRSATVQQREHRLHRLEDYTDSFFF